VQTLHNAILISIGIVAAAGLASGADAQQKINKSGNSHEMTVRLPNGSLEQIRYIGDQPPEITFPHLRALPFPSISIFDASDTGSPFADLERISIEMDHETLAMLSEANLLAQMPSSPDDLIKVGFGKLPPGTQGYTVVSSMSGNNTCTRSVRYFSSGNGKPRVETSTSGNCGATQSPTQKSLHALSPKPAFKQQQSKLVEASYHAGSKETQTAGQRDLQGLARQSKPG
jgi:hypothetical protein